MVRGAERMQRTSRPVRRDVRRIRVQSPHACLAWPLDDSPVLVLVVVVVLVSYLI